MDDEPERMDPRCDAGGPGYMLWMEYRDDGGYVRATDYDALAAKLAAAERRERQLLDTTATCRMLRRELNTANAKLAKVKEDLEYWETLAAVANDRAEAAEQRVATLEAALPAVYRLALGDAGLTCEQLAEIELTLIVANPPYEEGYSDAASICFENIRALSTPTAAELMARIQTGEKE